MISLIVVLGFMNTASGELHPVSMDRLSRAVEIHAKTGFPILCTGGFGAFNTSVTPHAEFAVKFLLDKGAQGTSILDSVHSGNTVEDAVLVSKRLAVLKAEKLFIVTSDFHLERTRMIFSAVISGTPMVFEGVSHTCLTADERSKLQAHENSALADLRKSGVRFK